VVDDDQDVVEALGSYLAAVGLTVASTTSGEAAIAMARAMPLDVIVLDIAMPLVDGFTVIDALQRGKTTAEIPIVAFTGLPLEDVCRDPRLAGCVTKTCDPDDLVAAVVKAIAAAAVSSQCRSSLRVPYRFFG
jgi:CheY-like chemotaxis protein